MWFVHLLSFAPTLAVLLGATFAVQNYRLRSATILIAKDNVSVGSINADVFSVDGHVRDKSCVVRSIKYARLGVIEMVGMNGEYVVMPWSNVRYIGTTRG